MVGARRIAVWWLLLGLLGACSEPGGNLLHLTDPGTGPGEAWDLDVEEPAPDVEETLADDAVVAPDPWKEKDWGSSPDAATQSVRFITNKQYLPNLLNLLGGAKTSIDVATLEFLTTGGIPDDVFAALDAARKRGVKLRVLLDNTGEDAQDNDNQKRVDAMNAWNDAKVQAKLIPGSKTLHAKLVVVDGRWTVFGSTNWSASSMNYNNETDFIVDSTAVAGRFTGYVDKLWSSGAKTTIEAGPYDGMTLAGDGQYPDVALDVLATAGTGSRVRLIMYQLTYDASSDAGALVRALDQAKGRGADVKVVLELSQYFQSVTNANQKSKTELESRGIEVRMDTAATTTHAKLLVVDDTVVVASCNWTDSSFDSNHEIAGAFTDAGLAAQASAYFDGIWAVSQ